jgi:hypothetical protein
MSADFYRITVQQEKIQEELEDDPIADKDNEVEDQRRGTIGVALAGLQELRKQSPQSGQVRPQSGLQDVQAVNRPA